MPLTFHYHDTLTHIINKQQLKLYNCANQQMLIFLPKNSCVMMAGFWHTRPIKRGHYLCCDTVEDLPQLLALFVHLLRDFFQFADVN